MLQFNIMLATTNLLISPSNKSDWLSGSDVFGNLPGTNESHSSSLTQLMTYSAGMTLKETVCMTNAMMMSGDVQKWNPNWKVQ